MLGEAQQERSVMLGEAQQERGVMLSNHKKMLAQIL